MTTSLKAFLPTVAGILNVSTDALYERQRALVREGLLDAAPGRGPGSGVVVTPDSLALLLIAVLSSPSLSETGPRVRSIATGESVGGKCPLTGSTIFKDALALILSDENLSQRVTQIRATGAYSDAQIDFQNRRKNETSSFLGRMADKIGVRVTLSVDSEVIHKLTQAVTALLSTEKEAP